MADGNDRDDVQALLVFYQEVGAHLRDAAEKRDRLANVFHTIVLAAVSALLALRLAGTDLSTTLRPAGVFLGLGVVVFGELVLWGVIAVRKWHAEYVNCLILLQGMILRRDSSSFPEIPPARRYKYSPGAATSRSYMLVQVGLLWALLAVCYFGTAWVCKTIVWSTGAVLAMLTVSMNWIASRTFLDKAERKFWEDPGTSWVFAGFHYGREAGDDGASPETPG